MHNNPLLSPTLLDCLLRIVGAVRVGKDPRQNVERASLIPRVEDVMTVGVSPIILSRCDADGSGSREKVVVRTEVQVVCACQHNSLVLVKRASRILKQPVSQCEDNCARTSQDRLARGR
eukprot:4994627-Prymnesium_polylepis.2